MNRIQELEDKVKKLYERGSPDRDEWAEWLWGNHVVVVADYATELAKKYDADEDLSRAAALLHDIADASMKRRNPKHETESLKIARQLLEQTGYNQDEVMLLVDDAIRYHSCHDDERPTSIEGKVLATADSLAHLKTDFYVYAVWALGQEHKPLGEIKDWVLQKIERDLNKKIQFVEVREDARLDYEQIKALFSK